MVRADQRMRRKINEGGDFHTKIDKDNTKRMKLIIKIYGWPGKSLVGKKGADNAWLLVQHADHQINFQEKCLKLIKRAVLAGEAKKEHLAYLTDRILFNKNKKQLYGTQFKIKKNNKLALYQTRDLKNLDKRRKTMDLTPFKEYKKLIHESLEQGNKKR